MNPLPKNERGQALGALRACLEHHHGLVRLKDLAGTLGWDPVHVAAVMHALQNEGLVAYNLTTGYTLHEHPPQDHDAVSEAVLGEYGGFGGQPVGLKTLYPISYQNLGDLEARRMEKFQQADVNRQKTRARLKELAMELPPRRPLRPVKSDSVAGQPVIGLRQGQQPDAAIK